MPTIVVCGALVLATAVVVLAANAATIAAAFVDAQRRSVLGADLSGQQLYRLFWIGGALLSGVGFTLVAAWQGLVMPRDLTVGPIFVLGFVYGAGLEGRAEHVAIADAARFFPSQLVGPNMRMPLGLLVGGLLSFAWCRLAGIAWRPAGDRLAVAAAVWEGFGRIGCLMAGCCTGTVCPAWMSWACLRYPPRTDAFLVQMNVGLVDAGTPWSHPVHVLPAYFALTSLGLLMAAGWLLRRRASAGAVFALYAVGYPIVKLGLESLRGVPRNDLLLPIELAVMLALGILAAPWDAPARRRRSDGGVPGESTIATGSSR